MQDLAAQISFYRGNASLLQATQDVSAGGSGARFIGVGGRFISNAVAQAVLGWPAFNYKDRNDFKQNYAGNYVNLEFELIGMDRIAGAMDRAVFAAKALAAIKGRARIGMLNELNWIISQIRIEAANIVNERVYGTRADVLRYKESATHYEFTMSDAEAVGRTQNLYEAVQAGIKLEGNSISVGIDEELAPYWKFVERGHRVVLPGGVETHSFVLPRPFFAEIKEMANSMLEQWWAGLALDITLGERIVWNYVAHGPHGMAKTIASGSLVTAFGVAQKTFEGIDVSAGIEGV